MAVGKCAEAVGYLAARAWGWFAGMQDAERIVKNTAEAVTAEVADNRKTFLLGWVWIV